MEKRKNKGDEIWERAKILIVLAFVSGIALAMIIVNIIITIVGVAV